MYCENKHYFPLKDGSSPACHNKQPSIGFPFMLLIITLLLSGYFQKNILLITSLSAVMMQHTALNHHHFEIGSMKGIINQTSKSESFDLDDISIVFL